MSADRSQDGAWAFFDVGSNSILCLAVVVSGGVARVVYDGAAVTGLGRGLSPAGLHPDGRERTWRALLEHRAALTRLGLEPRIGAVATSAMRDAADGGDFARRIREELGIPVEIISGDREADLTWLAIHGAFPRLDPKKVVDIGGGSTELMRGEGAVCVTRRSLDVGSVRMTERHLRSDPPTDAELLALRGDVRRVLVSAPDLGRAVGVGSGSTVTTLVAIRDAIDPWDASRVHGARLSRSEVGALAERLGRLDVAARARLPGLPRARAEVIVGGALVLDEVMGCLDLDEIVVSERGLRYGVLAEALPGVEVVV